MMSTLNTLLVMLTGAGLLGACASAHTEAPARGATLTRRSPSGIVA